ncbi:transporter [Pseudomonas sp. CYM-20-01]|uniref:SphA family protein n=1 Tax=Pseudomonas sp. CYM-20-01 TaxID=2870750 RepID=UPI0020BD5917|nr:transporter [Pseudomonas sp. CYM-20-01]
MNKNKKNGPVLNITTMTMPLSLAVCLIGTTAHASEGGGSLYPLGIENFSAAGIPPPGWYGSLYYYSYSANKLRDEAGNKVPNNIKLNVDVIAPRLLLVTDKQVLGGTLLAQVVPTFVNSYVAFDTAPGVRLRDSKFAQGDLLVGVGVGYQYSDKTFGAMGLDVFAPTGSYHVDDISNTSRNYWGVASTYTFDYVDRAGFNFSTKVSYGLNFKNTETNYRSGQELIIDYSTGWGLNNGWTLGLGGHIYQQTTNDEQHGQTLSDTKGRAFAIGPSLKYDSGKGWFVTAKYSPEFDVRNRSEGSVFVIRIGSPL